MFKNSHRLILILISILAFIFVAEIAFRLVTPTQNKYCLWRPYWKVIFKPYPGIMPGVTGNAVFQTNSDGVRGDELANQRIKILAVGGSTTECLYIDQPKTWPYILQKNLSSAYKESVWVGNIGRSGLSTTGNLIELKYLLPQYKKIDLIIALAGFNDLQSSLLNTFIQNDLKSDQEKAEMVFIGRPAGQGALYTHSELLKAARNLINYYFRRNKGIVEDSVGSWYIGARNARKRALQASSLPDLTPSLEIFEKNINQMIDLAEQRSIRIIFITQPYLWDNRQAQDLFWFGFTDDKQKYYSLDALIDGLKKFNSRLLGVCKRRNIECIDLANLIPHDTGAFYDDVHFNEGGCRKVADVIGAYLDKENKIPAPIH